MLRCQRPSQEMLAASSFAQSRSPRNGTMTLDPEFSAALEAHSVELAEPIALKLQQYARLMWDWNVKLNLTRHTTWELFVGRDLRDCLQLANLIEAGEEVLDLGSGNGIPGIPLALMRPDIEVGLAESVTKRAKVLSEIVAELGIPVAVYGARGEDLLEDFRFTTVVARAVGSIAKFCRWIEPHWTNVDRLLLVKGPKWVEERGDARHQGVLGGLELRRVASYPLGDDVDSEGAVLQIWPSGRTGGRFQ